MKDEIDAAVSLVAHVATVMGALGLVALVTALVWRGLQEDEER
jgi:hypothetical protein